MSMLANAVTDAPMGTITDTPMCRPMGASIGMSLSILVGTSAGISSFCCMGKIATLGLTMPPASTFL